MRDRKKLDPRLLRLMAGQDQREMMSMAIERGEVAASIETPTAAQITKRVLIELKSSEIIDELQNVALSHVSGNIYSATVALSDLADLEQAREVDAIEAGRRWYPMLDTSLSETRADIVHTGSGTVTGRTGENVIVGIIDFGFDFTLDDFRNADGSSRAAFLWDQGLVPQPGEAQPSDFPYGTEYSRADIDAALDSGNPFQAIRHDPGFASHGTHVASTAAGNGSSNDVDFQAGRFIGAAPNATIIFVQPNSGDQSTSFTDSSNVADAVAYIFSKAQELRMPCVINMSLGQNGGSHDGESIVERAIDRLVEPSGRAFVSAAGNEHVWRGHASGTLAQGDTRTLRWKVGGGMPVPSGGSTGTGVDRTPSEMEIWYSSRDRFRVTLTDPLGNTATPVEPDGTPLFVQLNATTKVFVDSERFTTLNGNSRIYIEIEPAGFGQSVTPGEWRVQIEALESADGRFDAWIERDARDPTNNFADQSFFVGGDFDPVSTLGTPATTRRALAVANYDHRLLAPNDSSSRGPTRTGIHKPEIAAPGTGVIAACSLGGRPDGNGGSHPMRVSKSGTSMAAPHVAGIVALLFEEMPDLSAAQAATLLRATADNPDGNTGFDISWGYGRINAQRALALLRNPNQPGQSATS